MMLAKAQLLLLVFVCFSQQMKGDVDRLKEDPRNDSKNQGCNSPVGARLSWFLG